MLWLHLSPKASSLSAFLSIQNMNQLCCCFIKWIFWLALTYIVIHASWLFKWLNGTCHGSMINWQHSWIFYFEFGGNRSMWISSPLHINTTFILSSLLLLPPQFTWRKKRYNFSNHSESYIPSLDRFRKNMTFEPLHLLDAVLSLII